jgi:hypothetical protein
MTNKIKIAILALLVLGFTACEQYVDSIEKVDPTAPTDATLAQVLTSTQVGYIGFVEGDMARLAGIFTDQMTGADRQYTVYETYGLTAQDFDAPWGNVYATVLKGCKIVQRKAQENGLDVPFAIAQIMEAHTIGMAASLWGDIPYSEAINVEEFPNPSYDTQASVYAAAQSLLDDAIATLSGSPVGNNAGDIFGFSNAQWVAVANTLKAKFHLHNGNYAQALAAAANGITDASGDLMAPHGTAYTQNFNIWYSFLVYDRAGYMTAADALAPRLLDDGSWFDGSAYRGNAKTDESARFLWYYMPYEIYGAGYEPNYLSVYDWGSGDGFFGTETDYPLVTYAENQLIIAECELRVNGFAAGLTALNNYRAYLASGAWEPATSENALFYGFVPQYDAYVDADFQNGGMENADNIAQADALYREIIEEKYISMIGTLEVFNDMRRDGFGGFSGDKNWEILGVTPNAGSTIPQRYLIPQVEINSNSNVPASRGGLFDPLPNF